LALNLYAQAYDGHYPRKNNDCRALYPYTMNRSVLLCPSDYVTRQYSIDHLTSPPPARPGRAFVPNRMASSYVYKGGLTNDARADAAIAGESQAFHGDLVNVLYVGGHVRSIPAEGYKPVVAPEKWWSEPPPSPPATLPVAPAPPSGAT